MCTIVIIYVITIMGKSPLIKAIYSSTTKMSCFYSHAKNYNAIKVFQTWHEEKNKKLQQHKNTMRAHDIESTRENETCSSYSNNCYYYLHAQFHSRRPRTKEHTTKSLIQEEWILDLIFVKYIIIKEKKKEKQVGSCCYNNNNKGVMGREWNLNDL